MPSREDDALTWEGDDDPTLQPGGDAPLDASTVKPSQEAAEPQAEPADESSLPEEPQPSQDQGQSAASDEDAPERAALGNVALVSLGLLGGIYLFWTIGWVVGTTRLSAWIESGTDAVADFMFQGSMWLAVASPLVWFAIVLVWTRGAATWKRIALLVGGAVVLVPWPFLMSGSFIVPGVS